MGIAIIIVVIVVAITSVLVVAGSKYWEKPFSTNGLEGKTGFTILLNFKDGTTENVRLLDSQNPFEIWNRHGEEKEIESITYELAVQASGRNHNTVQIREKQGYDVYITNEIWINPPEGVDRQTLNEGTEYHGYLYKGILASEIDVDTTIEADGNWHTIASITISSDTLDNFVESNIDSTYTVGDDFLAIDSFLCTDAGIIEIKSDVMDDWITVDLPCPGEEICQDGICSQSGFRFHYLPPYGMLNWDSKIELDA